MELPVRRWPSTYHDRQSYSADSNVTWSYVPYDHESLQFPAPDHPIEMPHGMNPISDGIDVFTSSFRLPADVSEINPFVAGDQRHLVVWNNVDGVDIDGDDDNDRRTHSSRPAAADVRNANDVYCDTSDDGAISAAGEQRDSGAGHRRNARERDRVHTINSTFARLRQKLPLAAAYSATVRTADKSRFGGVAPAMFYRTRKLSKVR